jgi:hypothetical protein
MPRSRPAARAVHLASVMKLCIATLLGFLLLLSTARTARADSTMCRDGHLAVTGQRVYEVLVNCGRPTWSRGYGRGSEEWVYDYDDGSFPRLLFFQAGVLVRIEVLGGAR